MFLLWSLLASGCQFGRECRKPLEKNIFHKWKNKTPIHSTNVHLLYVPDTVLGAWGNMGEQCRQNSLPLCSLHSSNVTVRDRRLSGVVAGCTLKYFVPGWHQRQGGSLAETEIGNQPWAYLGEEVPGRGKREYKDSRAGMCLPDSIAGSNKEENVVVITLTL